MELGRIEDRIAEKNIELDGLSTRFAQGEKAYTERSIELRNCIRELEACATIKAGSS